MLRRFSRASVAGFISSLSQILVGHFRHSSTQIIKLQLPPTFLLRYRLTRSRELEDSYLHLTLNRY